MQNLLIRKATFSDPETIYQMMCELENITLNKVDFTRIYKSNVRDKSVLYTVATLEGKVVAFMSLHIQYLLHHSGRVMEIQELFVKKELRNLGIGKHLIQYARHQAKALGCKSLEVTSNLKRKRTHRFYIAHGLYKTHYKFTEAL